MKKIIGILLIVFSSMFLLFGVFFGLIFGGFGLIFGSVEDSVSEFEVNGDVETTDGTVDYVSENETCICYKVDGVEYTCWITAVSSSYPAGTEVEVLYDSSNPWNATVPEVTEEVFGILKTVFGGFGIGFALLFGVLGFAGIIGGILLLKSYKKNLVLSE